MRVKLALLAIAAALSFQGCKDDDPAAQQSCLPLHLNEGLIAFYTFGSGSLEDQVGNHDLTNTTTALPAEDRVGNTECAYRFDAGAGEFLSAASTDFLNGLDQFAVSIWYKPLNEERHPGDYELLIGRGENHAGWSLGLYDCRKGLFQRGNRALWDSIVYEDNNDCAVILDRQTGKWQHIVVTYDNGQLELYKNGIRSLFQNHSDGGPDTFLDLGALIVGKGFTGVIDDILIYNRVLKQSEVDALYTMPACCQ